MFLLMAVMLLLAAACGPLSSDAPTGKESDTPADPADTAVASGITSTDQDTHEPTEPGTTPITEPESESSAAHATEPPTELITEPPTEPITEPPTEPITEPQTEPITEPPVEPTPDPIPTAYPPLFQALLDRALLNPSEITGTDGDTAPFHMTSVSLYEVLTRAGVTSLADAAGETVPASKYRYWFLYAMDGTYSLYRLMLTGEQPGMGVSFVSLDGEILLNALDRGAEAYPALSEALHNATRGSSPAPHSRILTAYFANPASLGSYLLAEILLTRIAGTAADGVVAAPAHYAACSVTDREYLRVTEALGWLSERHPGLVLWDAERPAGIRLSNGLDLLPHEKQALLCLYTMNVTVCSFAAEISAHAAGCDNSFIASFFGTDQWKITDLVVSPYSSAAGTVARWDNAFGFYNLNSTAVKDQEKHHPAYAGEYAP